MQRYQRTIEYTYDERTQSAYLYFVPPGQSRAPLNCPCDGTMPGWIVLDFDEHVRIVGVEVLSPSTSLAAWPLQHTYRRRTGLFGWVPFLGWSRGRRERAAVPHAPRTLTHSIEVRYQPEDDTAYLVFAAPGAASEVTRRTIDCEIDRPITLEFDAGRQLVGIEFGEASMTLARPLLPDIA